VHRRVVETVVGLKTLKSNPRASGGVWASDLIQDVFARGHNCITSVFESCVFLRCRFDRTEVNVEIRCGFRKIKHVLCSFGGNRSDRIVPRDIHDPEKEHEEQKRYESELDYCDSGIAQTRDTARLIGTFTELKIAKELRANAHRDMSQ
jgi:hypothetical protein